MNHLASQAPQQFAVMAQPRLPKAQTSLQLEVYQLDEAHAVNGMQLPRAPEYLETAVIPALNQASYSMLGALLPLGMVDLVVCTLCHSSTDLQKQPCRVHASSAYDDAGKAPCHIRADGHSSL